MAQEGQTAAEAAIAMMGRLGPWPWPCCNLDISQGPKELSGTVSFSFVFQ